MLKRSLGKVTDGLKKGLHNGEWLSLFGAGAGSRRCGTFQDFCEAILLIKELMAENNQQICDDSIVVLNGLMSSLLNHLTEEEVSSSGHPGQCLEKLVEESLLELVMRWCCRLASVEELWRVQLRFFLVLISESSQPVLQQMAVVRPLKRILRECSRVTHHAGQARCESKVDEAYVQLLAQLCLIMSHDVASLEQFLAVDGSSGSGCGDGDRSQCAEFAIFSYLVPFMHYAGTVGTQARDALLLCLLQASSNKRALLYIKNDSSFCVMLALGLGGLFSELPTQLKFSCSEWCDLAPMVTVVPGLHTFVQSLQFCSDVIQLSLPDISCQLASLIRTGLLEQILAHWILQTSSKNTTAGVAYLNLVLSLVSEPALLYEVIRFIFQHVDEDGNRLLHRLIAYINSRDTQLSNVTLALFRTLLELNCEDVLLEIALRYLLPGDHIQPSQWHLVSAPDLSCEGAVRFLAVVPSCCWRGEQLYMDHAQRISSTVDSSQQSSSSSANSVTSQISTSGSPSIQPVADTTVVGAYRKLLAEAHDSVQSCLKACKSWSNSYVSCQSIHSSAADVLHFSGWSSLASSSSVTSVSSASAHTPKLSTRSTTSTSERQQHDDGAAAPTFSQLPAIDALSRPMRQESGRQRANSTDSCSSHASSGFPSSGLFLAALLDRLGGLLTLDSFSALLVMNVLTRLAHFPQPLLTSYLLNHALVLKPEVPSLHRTLNNLKTLIDSMDGRYEDFPHFLARARKTLLAREVTNSSAPSAAVSAVTGHRTEAPSARHASILASSRSVGSHARASRQGSMVFQSDQIAGRSAATASATSASAGASATSGAGKVKRKRPAAQMLYSIVMLHEFLKEMSAISQEQSLAHFDMIRQP